MTKTALISGTTGQDGAYLAKLLLSKGYEVWGTSRDAELSSFSNLKSLGIYDQIHRRSMSLTDFRSVLQVIEECEPDEVYNLAGQSSVGLSFQQPVETLESIAFGTLNLLEVLRYRGRPVRLYNAASGECFGETTLQNPAREDSSFHPRSPYGVAKCTSYWSVVNYREAYGLFACSGILFNHESPLRPERFVTRKIVSAAHEISLGKRAHLELGNLDVVRDWGWAPEYVEAMWSMLQQGTADDFIIATGQSHSLQYFVQCAFEALDLDWKDWVRQDRSLLRAADISQSFADPAKANTQLNWHATVQLKDIVSRLIEDQRSLHV